MDKDYTKDYPQEDVLRGLEDAVKTVESPFHEWCVNSAWVDLVCDSQYCLYCCLTLLVHCLQMGVRQGVPSGSDEQVGSTSRSTAAQTNTDKDEMEEVVDEEEEEEEEEAPTFIPIC